MTNTGVFEGHEMTTLISFDRDRSSLMFKGDEVQLEKHIDSIAD